MKKIQVLLSLALCLALLTACGGGDISLVGRRIGQCELFSEWQIANAMDEVERYFQKELDGCKLLRLEYDEQKTQAEAREWAAQYGAEEAIVLYSDFSVDATGGDGSLSPGDTYRNWKWVLTRSVKGEWELRTWGYG